jgi:hypothetical protein
MIAEKLPVKLELALPGLANPRYKDLSYSELLKKDYRVIGGDKADLHFQGYELDRENNKTILCNPFITTGRPDWFTTDEEIHEAAMEVLMFSFDSIGYESVE